MHYLHYLHDLHAMHILQLMHSLHAKHLGHGMHLPHIYNGATYAIAYTIHTVDTHHTTCMIYASCTDRTYYMLHQEPAAPQQVLPVAA
jgi:hypothetical protein